MELFNLCIMGIASFVFSGLDDFILMMIMYIYAYKYFNIGVLGIFISVNTIIIISIFVGYISELIFYQTLNLGFLEYIHYFIYLYLLYLVVDFISNKDSNIITNKFNSKSITGKSIFFTAGIIYFIQGLDDFIIYSSSFLKISIYHSINMYLAYIFGVYIGLFSFWITILFFGKIIKKNREQNKNKKEVVMNNDEIMVNKDFLRVLSKSKIIEKIEDLSEIFFDASKIIKVDRMILYELVDENNVKVIFIYTHLKQDIQSNDIVCISDNINLVNAIETNEISKIPVPDIGEDLVIPLNNTYFLAIDDINEARILTEVDEFLIETLALSMSTSLKMMRLVEENIKDPLTGILNRGVLNRLIDFNETPYGFPYTPIHGIAFIDIDFFGEFNKKYGHAVGDVILKEVANILDAFFKHNNGLMYRYGGEEFVGVLFDNDVSIYELSLSVQKYIAEHIVSFEGREYNVKLSIGTTSTLLASAKNNVDYIKEANQSLLIAKETGRNKVVDYSSI